MAEENKKLVPDDVEEMIKELSPYYSQAEKSPKIDAPATKHNIVYNSSSETLEPIYFWILDFLNNDLGADEVVKLVDNFTSTPGSGHFSELMGKATKMQEEAMKVMGQVNTVVRSILNIIYDLKEFEMRLKEYDLAKSSDKSKRSSGMLALKQIWMDSVDLKKGRGSINQMAQQLQFVTLRDAFMAADSVEDIDKGGEEGKGMDLNDRVKRILKARLQEFFEWKERSERELRKRYEVERTYLKSQVASLKMYTRWAKPYLKAANELEQLDLGKDPNAIKTFNTILLKLTIVSKHEYDPTQDILDGNLPKSIKKSLKKNKLRKYTSCVFVDFDFRGIPQKAGQHYAFGGLVDVKFKAYALNEDELKMLDQKLEEDDLNDGLKLVEGMTDDSLEHLREDIEKYLNEEDIKRGKKEEKEKKKEQDVNPFAALIGLGNSKKDEEEDEEKEEDKKITEVKPDSHEEKLIRDFAEADAKGLCYKVYDIYKKGHGMKSLPRFIDE